MTNISITSQISLFDIFGKTGCIIYVLCSWIQGQLLVSGGFGMAIFRMICIENLLKQIDRSKLVKIILIGNFIVLIGTTAISTFGMINIGWDKNKLFRFCMDYGTAKGDFYHSYFNNENEEFGKYSNNQINRWDD